jgi:hemerythrin
MSYEWSRELETGNAMIDSQHKQLIKAVNDLLQACSSGKGRAGISSTIDFLTDYTAKHFGDEEKLQVRYCYPDMMNHKRYHDGFKTVVRELGLQLKAEGPSIQLVSKVNTSIGGWLINHIKKEDVKVAVHIKGKTT